MEKLEIKRIGRDEALLLNSIYQRNQGLYIDLENDRYKLVFLPDKKDVIPEISIRISGNGSKFWVGLEKAFFMGLIGGTLSGETFFDLPAEVRDAVLEAVLEKPLNRLESWSGTSVVVEEILSGTPEDSEEKGIRLNFMLMSSEKSRPDTGCFYLDSKSLEWLGGLLNNLPGPPLRDMDDLPICVHFEIGRTSMSLNELDTAEPEDIIIMDHCYLNDQNRILGRFSGNFAFQGVLKDSIVTVEKMTEELMGENGEKNETEEHGETKAQAADHIDEVPIELVFELGRKSMPLGELRALQPGQAIDLEKSMVKPVSIKANNRLIGQGELVRLDDHIGVKIIDIFGGKHGESA